MANASHMALPAACATTPRIEKMPAPTMPPMPIDTAAARPICPAPAGCFFCAPDGRVVTGVVIAMVAQVLGKLEPGCARGRRSCHRECEGKDKPCTADLELC